MVQYEPELRLQREVGELFRRSEHNPILTAAQWPYPCNSVFNPAAVELETGETLLLVRVEDLRGFSHLTAARSADGVTGWRIDEAPTLLPDPLTRPEELWGLEDPRAVWVEELGTYVVTYTAFSEDGPLVAMAQTTDFVDFRCQGPVMPPEDKNAALFPRRIGGQWLLLHRPASAHAVKRPHIWASRSNDLEYWSEPRPLLAARDGGWWDHTRIGLAAPPIETPEGWLLFYHGVRDTVAGSIYRVGLALLDLEDPFRVIRRSGPWLLSPTALYEREGDVPNVVFPCGVIYDAESDRLRLYYGAADTCVALATCSLSDLLLWLKEHEA
jgi:predicted GH43/DUF377 family glycosyl hydrolase